MRSVFARIFLVVAVLLGAACTSAPDDWSRDVTGLEQAILALSPDIDPQEARAAATIAYDYSLQLAQDYNVTDPPLIHNAKVNQGLRPRGLCWHWADDLEKRLRYEGFTSVSLHRAIANSDNLRIQHSTVVLSAKGAPMTAGIVLDPWRYGGKLFWSRVAQDTRYRWRPRTDVLAERRAP